MAVIRAAVYARVSTKPQAGEDKISITDQLRECRKYIEREGWILAGEFVDPGVTARTTDRPGLKALFTVLETFDVVIAWDFDRFYRDRISVAGYILDTLDENRKQITSIKQPIPIYDAALYDPRENDTPYMLREMAGFTSGIDNRRRFRTLQKGLKERFQQGYMQKHPPLGYQLNVKIEAGKVVRLPRVIVPEEARTVRRIYAEYKEGRSYVFIARRLNSEAVQSPAGGLWSANVVRSVIRNPTYCGKVYRATIAVRGKRKMLPDNKWEIVPGKHEPIIPESLWNEVQEIRRRKVKRTRAVGSSLLLSGILRCGYCGYSMCNDGAWGGGYYICGQYKQMSSCRRNSYRRIHLERDVLNYIFNVLRNEDLYEEAVARRREESNNDLADEVKRLEMMLAEFPERKRRLFDLYERDQIRREEFLHRKDEHNQTQAQIAGALEQKQTALAKAVSTRLTRETFDEILKTLEEQWERCDMAVRKQKLSSLIEKIMIQEGAFKIHFRTGI